MAGGSNWSTVHLCPPGKFLWMTHRHYAGPPEHNIELPTLILVAKMDVMKKNSPRCPTYTSSGSEQ